VLRNIGVGFAHSVIAYHATLKGLSKVSVSPQALLADLDASWEVLAEPIQTVMRRFNVDQPYEKLKALTRGQRMTQEVLADFVEALDIPEEGKALLRALRPENYIGNAVEQARKV
jgi:adenylosuccinate lyase